MGMQNREIKEEEEEEEETLILSLPLLTWLLREILISA